MLKNEAFCFTLETENLGTFQKQQECTAKRSCVYTWDCFSHIFVARFPKTVSFGCVA